VDADGYVYIVDRKKDVIKYRAFHKSEGSKQQGQELLEEGVRRARPRWGGKEGASQKKGKEREAAGGKAAGTGSASFSCIARADTDKDLADALLEQVDGLRVSPRQ
jgi:hypothetical protein